MSALSEWGEENPDEMGRLLDRLIELEGEGLVLLPGGEHYWAETTVAQPSTEWDKFVEENLDIEKPH